MQQPSHTLLAGLLSDALQTEQLIAQVMESEIRTTNVPPLKMQMERHLQETYAQVDRLTQRLQEMGLAQPLRGLAPSPFRAMLQAAQQATGIPETADVQAHLLMENTWSSFATENYEIAMYRTIETLANNMGDEMTATLARQNRKEEEMSARFLEGHAIDVVNLVESGNIAASTPGLTREAAMAGAGQIPGAAHDTQLFSAPPVASDVTHIGPAGGNEWNLQSSAMRAQWEQGRDPSSAYQWNEAEPYLRHGYEAAASGRYAGRTFADVENDLRTQYYATPTGTVTPTYATPTEIVSHSDSDIPDVYKGDVYVGDVYGDEVASQPAQPAAPPPEYPQVSPGERHTGHSMPTSPEQLADRGITNYQPEDNRIILDPGTTQRDPSGWNTFRTEVQRGFESFFRAGRDTANVTNEDQPEYRQPTIR